MIFQEEHIHQILSRVKTQTRRYSGKYQKNHLYSIQPGRGKPGILSGAIYILAKKKELRGELISRGDAKEEGSYEQKEYEVLYEILNPKWVERWAYSFVYVPREIIPKRWWKERNRVLYNPRIGEEFRVDVDQIIRMTGWRGFS